jgi:hypothetical protein
MSADEKANRKKKIMQQVKKLKCGIDFCWGEAMISIIKK